MPIFDKKAQQQKKPNNKERWKEKEIKEVKVKQMVRGSPRKEVTSSIGQHGKHDNQQAYMHNEK